MSQITDSDQTTNRSIIKIPPALRYPAYRNYWFGTLASVSGFQMLQATQFWLIHILEDSPIYLGYVGLANAIPAIALNLFGGVLADKLDKQRLIMVTQTILAGLIFLLGALTLQGAIESWHVLVIAFVAGAVNAFDQPARQALYPHLIDRKVMMSAVALNSSIWQGTRIVAPAMAGVLIGIGAGNTGSAIAFFVAGSGFLVMALVIAKLKVPHIEKGATGSAIHDMLEGVKFIKRNSIFSFLIGMTFFNSFFGMAYIVMMPVIVEDVLNQGSGAYGLLLSFGGVGALITSLWLGSVGNIRRKGMLLIGGAVMFGLSVASFALTADLFGIYILALGLMFIMGIFNTLYMTTVMSSLQMMVPDKMRGRVMGFYGMTWSIMPLGGMYAGALGAFIGVPTAIMIGGLVVSGFALGPAMINKQVRNIGALLRRAEEGVAASSQPQHATQSTGDD